MIRNRIIPTVGIGLLLLLPLWVWAQGPAPDAAAKAGAVPAQGAAVGTPTPTPAAPPTEAELALDEAIAKVTALGSISAKLVQKIEMLKQKFEIQGQYLKASGGRLYLRLTVLGLPGSTGEMVQVCDGVTIWDFQQILDSKYYRKVTLGQILAKLKAPELDAAARDQVLARLGVAGPEVLLVGLRKAIHFDQKEEGTSDDGHPVWILHGTWQDRQGLVSPNQQPLPVNAPLPAFVPSQATLYIGKADGWPYRVRLAGRQPTVLFDTRRQGPDGRPIGPLSSIQTIEPSTIDLTYTLVTFDPKLKGDEFNFPIPANVRVDDSTDTVLSELEQMIQMKIAQKKAETAKAEPLLPQSIDIPKAAPSPEGSSVPTPPPLATKPK